MYPAILILPIASIYGIPKYPTRRQPNPTNEAEPSFIEFFAFKFKGIPY